MDPIIHHQMTELVNNVGVVIAWSEVYNTANILEGLRKTTNLSLNRSVRTVGLRTETLNRNHPHMKQLGYPKGGDTLS